ncbi:DUF1440 domain-containing protein [Herbidospora mongoliensis]|uniref:DUF1440 domain-containing protein n=1 Tax=Herbidospora mongoliensis TaxID=688067 RepID=UPI000A8B5811|nr:DUF1440 domain-containing protein [Herbidospora mongoliensis]
MKELSAGAVGGLLATGAMSLVMLAGHRMGLLEEQPPKRIIRAVLPGPRHRPKPGEKTLAVLSHFGFGAAAGSAFALATRQHRPPASVGAGYGLAIWLAAYQGWVPALGALPPVSRDRPGRQVVMAAGHVVYGTTLAIALNHLGQRR